MLTCGVFSDPLIAGVDMMDYNQQGRRKLYS